MDMVNKAIPQKKGVESMSFISDYAAGGKDKYVGAFAYIVDNV